MGPLEHFPSVLWWVLWVEYESKNCRLRAFGAVHVLALGPRAGYCSGGHTTPLQLVSNFRPL